MQGVLRRRLRHAEVYLEEETRLEIYCCCHRAVVRRAPPPPPALPPCATSQSQGKAQMKTGLARAVKDVASFVVSFSMVSLYLFVAFPSTSLVQIPVWGTSGLVGDKLRGVCRLLYRKGVFVNVLTFRTKATAIGQLRGSGGLVSSLIAEKVLRGRPNAWRQREQ